MNYPLKISRLRIIYNILARNNENWNAKMGGKMIKYTNLFGVHGVIGFPVRSLIAVAHVRDVAKATTLLVTK